MAEVYLARRRAAGVEKLLVVKRIRAERATDVKFLDLFVREARLSMSLAHQNIVPVFDFGRIDDQVFLAMERVEGRDLGSSLARGATLDPPRAIPALVAAFVASECCQALDYAHRRKSPEGTPLGIVHRDVTPRNVLLSWAGEVKLTDFGIAALAGDQTTQLLGTPAYMAPEQARQQPVDLRADVYAIGLVLREMLTGERVRSGHDREALVAAARAAELPEWPTTRAIAPRLVEIVDRATAATPDARFTDAREMLAALDDFAVGERAANRGESPARQLAAWLDAVWGTEREDVGPDGEIDAQHMLSFLDDGGLDAIGTGTQRSLLATAADESRDSDEPAPPPEPAPPLAKANTLSRRATIGIGIGGFTVFALIAVVIVVLVRRGEENVRLMAARADASLENTNVEVPLDAESLVAPVDAELISDAPDVSPDAAIVEAPRDAGVRRPRPDAAITAGRPDAPVSAAVMRRKVTINAIPWANFTVDGDSTQHQTIKTIELTPGAHIIHFANPVIDVTRDVTIDVPADRDMKHVERLQ